MKKGTEKEDILDHQRGRGETHVNLKLPAIHETTKTKIGTSDT